MAAADETPDKDAASAPKKAAQKKKPAEAKPAGGLTFQAPNFPPLPKLLPPSTSKPAAAPAPAKPAAKSSGVAIPIKPVPETVTFPSKMKIEPDTTALDDNDEVFRMPPRKPADMTKPPKILMEGRKAAKGEVVDILEEPEQPKRKPVKAPKPVRATVRSGLFRKIAIGFAVLAVLLGVLVAYVVYAHATILIYPQKSAIHTEQDVTVAVDPKGTDLAGQVEEVTVSGERTEAPNAATNTPGVALGKIKIVNESARDFTLIPTTRFLTSEGILFRLKNRIHIPAGGDATADVYADQAGAAGEIGPTRFTIPGLNASEQKSVYGVSDAAMMGGVNTTGSISQDDIDRTEKDLREELGKQAAEELTKKIDPKWTGSASSVDTVTRFVNAAAGDTSAGVTVRLTLHVRTVAFDRDQALAVATQSLKGVLTPGLELLDTDADHAEFDVSNADPAAGTGSIQVKLSGNARMTLNSPQFDPAKLRGMSLKQVQDYFTGIEGVERVDVRFRPAFIKRMPDLQDHIEFQIQK